jgi:iron complex outermembrane recepter protein
MHRMTLACVSAIALASNPSFAEETDPEFEAILRLDIAEMTVTSVSKRAQKITDVPAAVYVITQEDIRRSGITTLPETLRMVPGMQVARTDSSRWAISARGFNNTLSNKLLVMIDGRSVYAPVLSGVYWDDQSTMLRDIERIEVIRGPGASLWGANAVNGIINIITKNAADTQGNYVSTGIGNEEDFIEGRRGGKLGTDGYYRAYAQYYNYDDTKTLANQDSLDDWYRARSGFRIDTKRSQQDSFTFQGDFYGGQQQRSSRLPILTAPFTETIIGDNESYGGNLLGRWNRVLSKDSDISLQAYIDHYTRHEANTDQHVSTADIEFQQNLRMDNRHNLVWGGNARLDMEYLSRSFSIQFNERQDQHEMLSTFIQDEYAVIPDSLYFTFGSKFEYTDINGFEIMPSGRLAWHPTDNQMLWGSISRAVRTPGTRETDLNIAALVVPGAPPNTWRVFGTSAFKAEELIAYELGHRIQPTSNLTLDTSLFFNDYDQLRTFSNPGTPFIDPSGNLVTPFLLSNLGAGHTYGVEVAATWNATDKWRLTGSYSYLKMNLRVRPGAFVNLEGEERQSPHHQFSVRSYYNVTDTVKWDNMLYFVDHISAPIGSYLRYDTRIAWEATPGMELSLTGRNLLDPRHPEFTSTPQAQIERSLIGRVSLKF